MNRYFVLYLAALIVLTGLDFLFLGVVAKGFFTSEVGDMLGGIRIAPAIPIYLLYGALFGLFCYATFDLTSLSLLLQLAGRGRRCLLGRDRDGSLIDRRASRC